MLFVTIIIFCDLHNACNVEKHYDHPINILYLHQKINDGNKIIYG